MKTLDEVKDALVEAEARLEEEDPTAVAVFDTPAGPLEVQITQRFVRRAKKSKVWRSRAMLTAFKNAGYGLVAEAPRSRGGMDGIFLLDRDHRPRNAMMRKLFDRFLDRPDPLVAVIRRAWNADVADLIAVRVVSHHMRLLGVLHRGETDRLALVDHDA